MKPLLSALCLGLIPLAAFAQDDGTLIVHDGYARAANPRSGAAFMVVENRGVRGLYAIDGDLGCR
ncbi:hypothetical protein [Paracoccus sp. (in: a-proteobacteria)]|uniref:hypothetical protein n=1 Tax=Paracoccus sp. TaxID=267 RepID=UPI002AFE551E|nr:hypothetical protein [Paracoccus sp. (in: a-proteobacteria)]